MTLPCRKLHRLTCWDYTQTGYYFITICTKDKRKLLSSIHQDGLDAVVLPTKIGKMILDNWKQIATVYPGVETDYVCIMPNHLHGILIINAPEQQQSKSLSSIVRAFKSVTTRKYNELVPETEKNRLWQSSFYDEIIRNDDMLEDVRNYIVGNPSKWMDDPMYAD